MAKLYSLLLYTMDFTSQLAQAYASTTQDLTTDRIQKLNFSMLMWPDGSNRLVAILKSNSAYRDIYLKKYSYSNFLQITLKLEGPVVWFVWFYNYIYKQNINYEVGSMDLVYFPVWPYLKLSPNSSKPDLTLRL